MAKRVYGTLRERFFPKTIPANSPYECWGWDGSTHRQGYGFIKVEGRVLLAHRVSWEIHFGSIPDGLQVLHYCDNPPCTNPIHLFLGTNLDNCLDKCRKFRSAPAPSGLPYGVTFLNDKPRKKPFQARVTLDGVFVHLGTFRTAEEAHAVAVASRREN